MYTKGAPTGAVKNFIDYVMSPEFQDVYVEKAEHFGYKNEKIIRSVIDNKARLECGLLLP